MAKPYKEKELKDLYPNFEELLVKLLNQHGQTYAAVQLGVSQATVSEIVKRSARIKRVCHYELISESEAETLQTT